MAARGAWRQARAGHAAARRQLALWDLRQAAAALLGAKAGRSQRAAGRSPTAARGDQLPHCGVDDHPLWRSAAQRARQRLPARQQRCQVVAQARGAAGGTKVQAWVGVYACSRGPAQAAGRRSAPAAAPTALTRRCARRAPVPRNPAAFPGRSAERGSVKGRTAAGEQHSIGQQSTGGSSGRQRDGSLQRAKAQAGQPQQRQPSSSGSPPGTAGLQVWWTGAWHRYW